jgi:hypothetical protein
MSKTLVLEIPGEIFDLYQIIAESRGQPAEKVILETILRNFLETNKNLNKQEKTDALKKLMKSSSVKIL